MILTSFQPCDAIIVAMSLINLLSKSRGTGNLVSRIRTILRRFGVSSKKFEHLLNQYSAVTRNLGCVPTFPITAVTMKRHPKLVKNLYQQGVELAVHGYIHTDYGVLPLEEQAKHFEKAIATFRRCQIPFIGFRAPFLRVNDQTPKALSKFGFPYDSSYAVHWDVFDKTKYAESAWSEYERLLEFYQSRQAQDYLVLPRSVDGFVEIPVSMPDDEAMVERLDITAGNKISALWQDVLQRTYNSGELFTVQLHPERIPFCQSALIELLQQARGLNPPVWVASLGEIAEWWKERSHFKLKISSGNKGEYRVRADCSNRATVLLKNSKANVPVDEWFDDYQIVTARNFILESQAYPVIGVRRDSSQAAINFLQSEGYIVEKSDQPGNYGIYLNNLTEFDEADEKALSLRIEQSDAPMLRYWRWPNQARSALSVTGDIDSITLIDFVLRILENWRQRLR